MKRSAFLAVGIATAAALSTTSLAFATPDTGPDTEACTAAKASLAAAVALVVDLNAEVYPDGMVPAVEDVTPALLEAILDDPDLGAGGRVEVEAALGAFAAVDRACAEPTPSTTPVTPAPTTTPTTTAAPTTAPGADDDFDQVGTPPRGGVQTGAR